MNDNKKDFRRAILKRAAVISFALAAVGIYLWFGWLLDSIDTVIFSVIAALTVLAMLWPITPMPARVRVPLPHRLRTSRHNPDPANPNGRKPGNQQSRGA